MPQKERIIDLPTIDFQGGLRGGNPLESPTVGSLTVGSLKSAVN